MRRFQFASKPVCISIIVIGFTLYYAVRGYMCPCPPRRRTQQNDANSPLASRLMSLSIPCARYEINGWQINHLIFYTCLGVLFPDDFWLWQVLGVLWELLEFVPYVYPSVLSYVGGCVDVGVTSETHWIDQCVGLHSPRAHFWHVKLTDVIQNVVGFGIGVLVYRGVVSKYAMFRSVS